MIFLDLYTLPNVTTGMDALVVQTVAEVPAFVPLLLVFIFFTVFLGGIMRQKFRTGSADYPAWSVVASIATLMVSLVLSMISGILLLEYLIIVIVITIFSGMWLFLDTRGSEV